MSAQTVTPDDPRWATIDGLLIDRRRLNAAQEITRVFGCGIGDAVTVLGERYTYLKATKPERFPLSDQEFWEGFSS
jgi:hypothetical protein